MKNKHGIEIEVGKLYCCHSLNPALQFEVVKVTGIIGDMVVKVEECLNFGYSSSRWINWLFSEYDEEKRKINPIAFL